MSSPRFRVWHALGFALLVILAADFSAKQIYWFMSGQKPRESPTHRQPSRQFHHGLRPNSTGKDYFGGKETLYFINSEGMRDREIREIPRDPGRPRLLFAGDSFTEGIYLPYEETYVGKIAAEMGKKGVDVQNAGVAGYCPTLYDFWVRHLMTDRGLRVDAVVVAPDISDIFDEHFYRRNDDGTVTFLTHGPFQEAGSSLERWNVALGWIETHVEGNFVLLGALVRNARLAFLKSRWVPWYVRAKDETRLWEHRWPEYRGPYETHVKAGMRKAGAAMEDLAVFLRQRKIPLTVVVYPNPIQVQEGREDSLAATFWRDWCRQHGVGFFSLFPAFLRSGSPDEVISRYYIPGDTHWNAAGHALVAQALLRASDELGWNLLQKSGMPIHPQPVPKTSP